MNPQDKKILLGVVVAVSAAFLCPYIPPARAGELESQPSSVRFLPIDPNVSDEIALVDRFAARQEWLKAIEICQKYIARPANTVVEVRKGVYASARVLCAKKLAALPQPAKLQYRTLYGPEAERLYHRAVNERDAAAARTLASEFAFTSRGPDGMNLLAQFLFEKGEVRGALGWWLCWMDRVDAASVPEPERRLVAAKAAVAAAEVGNHSALKRAVELFGDRGTAVRIGGTKIVRSEELEEFAAPLWMKAGDKPPAVPAGFDFVRWAARCRSGYARRIDRYYGSSGRITYSCHGDLSGGVLYVNTPDAAQAFDALTGRVLWRRAVTNYDNDYYRSVRPLNFYCRVYPAADRPGRRTVFVSGGARLAACDAETGHEIWSKNCNSFAAVDPIGRDQALRIAFSSPVLCRQDKAYVMLETSRGQVYLLAFDRSDGGVVWCTSAGGSMPKSGYRTSFPSSIVRVGSGLVFCNGRGVIGNCDGATGEIRWLVPYRRQKRFVTNQRLDLSHGRNYCPVVVAGDCVVCRPADSQQVISIRISDGEVTWRKDMPGEWRLLGALGPGGDLESERVIIAGKDVRCLSADNGSILWTWPVPEPGPVGLGRVTDRGVLVATNGGVWVLGAASGELVRFAPLDFPGGEMVNVCCDRDSVALVSENSVCVLGSSAGTSKLLESAAAHYPRDPWVAAMEARLLRSQGNNEQALQRLAEAVERVKRQSGGRKLAASLERETVDLYRQLYAAEWAAGRRVAAFRWMHKALHSPGQIPYECRLGYREETGREPSEPHKLVMASGDHLSGRLTGIRGDAVTFVVKGKPWGGGGAGIDRVIIKQGFEAAKRDSPSGGRGILVNGDPITCGVEWLHNGVLRVNASFAGFELDLSEVSAIIFGGAAGKAPVEVV